VQDAFGGFRKILKVVVKLMIAKIHQLGGFFMLDLHLLQPCIRWNVRYGL
jgi:hypothetical protein